MLYFNSTVHHHWCCLQIKYKAMSLWSARIISYSSSSIVELWICWQVQRKHTHGCSSLCAQAASCTQCSSAMCLWQKEEEKKKAQESNNPFSFFLPSFLSSFIVALQQRPAACKGRHNEGPRLGPSCRHWHKHPHHYLRSPDLWPLEEILFLLEQDRWFLTGGREKENLFDPERQTEGRVRWEGGALEAVMDDACWPDVSDDEGKGVGYTAKRKRVFWLYWSINISRREERKKKEQ